MLIYEVTATVDSTIASEFETFMVEQHIPDLLRTGNFEAACLAKSGSQFRMSYHCKSQDELDLYLANDAERLRADFKGRFPAGVELSRRILQVVKLFPGR